ncbi:MAG: hypothetical protein ACD_46C00021G0007 [uncultured bacterium]|nr:MAG: hypothetical protein ACD_46C00021G0007 [uncultured bacterium]
MNTKLIEQKEMRAYTLLVSLVICGLASSLITAPKPVIAVDRYLKFSARYYLLLYHDDVLTQASQKYISHDKDHIPAK